MYACTEPVRTGIGAVCVEYGRPKWPITMLNHTNRHPWYRILFGFLFLAPYTRTTRYEEAFLPEGKKHPRSLRSLGFASLLVYVIVRLTVVVCNRRLLAVVVSLKQCSAPPVIL